MSGMSDAKMHKNMTLEIQSYDIDKDYHKQREIFSRAEMTVHKA